MRNELSDETEYLNYGQESVLRAFTELQWSILKPSSWTAFPTEDDPEALYKFFSIELYVSLDSIVTERETYSLLNPKYWFRILVYAHTLARPIPKPQTVSKNEITSSRVA